MLREMLAIQASPELPAGLVLPELLEENGLLPSGSGDVPFAITAERIEHAKRVSTTTRHA